MVEQCVGDKLKSRLSCWRAERASLFDGKPTVIEIYSPHHWLYRYTISWHLTYRQLAFNILCPKVCITRSISVVCFENQRTNLWMLFGVLRDSSLWYCTLSSQVLRISLLSLTFLYTLNDFWKCILILIFLSDIMKIFRYKNRCSHNFDTHCNDCHTSVAWTGSFKNVLTGSFISTVTVLLAELSLNF